jgi:hypothetical protein
MAFMQAVAYHPGRELRTRSQTDFVQCVADMHIGSTFGNHQGASDLAVGKGLTPVRSAQ